MDVPGFKLGRQYDGGHDYQNYSALDLKNQKTVNIQLFSPSLVSNQTFFEQFQKITSRLVNNTFGTIAPILHAEISDHACYIITEHYTCSKNIFSGSFISKKYQVMQLALKIAKSLDELHKSRLVHGGIEWNALCFGSSDSLILKQPALERVIPILRPTALKTLTPAQSSYLAPEAYVDLTPATDFYALGVLIYQLLFGPNSFNADIIESQQQYIFRTGHQDLDFLFRQLLTNDVDQRIQNHAQFKSAVQRCGVKPVAISLNSRKDATNDLLTSEKNSGSFFHWIKLATGIAVFTLAGMLSFSIVLDKIQPHPEVSKTESIEVSENSDAETAVFQPSSNRIKPLELSTGFNMLFEQALTQVKTNPKTALRIINVALKQNPDNLDAINLKQRIEQKIEIDSILDDAELLIEDAHLLTPKGDNAYESYMNLAKILSADDERIRNGLTRIAAKYYALSENELANNHLEKALEYIGLGLSVKNDSPQLIKLRSAIVERKRLLESNLQVAHQDQKQRLREKEVTGELIRRQVRQIKNAEPPSNNRKSEKSNSDIPIF